MRGSQTPRLSVTPEAAYSLGEEAADLAQLAGLTLDPWQRLSLDMMLGVRADGKWAAFEAAVFVPRQNGKGSALEARVVASLLLLGDPLTLWSAHQYKTSMEAFRRVKILLDNLENAGLIARGSIKVNSTNGDEGFELRETGQRIRFVARSKSSGRGFSSDCIILDETFAYTHEQHAALLPTVSARANPQIIYTSTPPLDGDTGEVMYQLRGRAERGDDPSLGYLDWGLAGDLEHLSKLDLDDRSLWAASSPAYGIRISEETVRRERASMSDVDFARERLGVWPRENQGGGAIDMRLWHALADMDSRRSGDVALGVDISPSRDYAAIAMYGARNGSTGHGQLVDYRLGTDWVIPRLTELRLKLGPLAIAAGRGTYASLKTGLAEGGFVLPNPADKPRTGDVVPCGGVDMAAATGQLLDAVKQGTFHHIGQRELDAAAAGVVTKETGDALAWSRKDAAADTTPLVALTLARWAYTTREPLLRGARYNVLESVW